MFRENRNRENFFCRVWTHFREILHHRRFPTMWYISCSLSLMRSMEESKAWTLEDRMYNMYELPYSLAKERPPVCSSLYFWPHFRYYVHEWGPTIEWALCWLIRKFDSWIYIESIWLYNNWLFFVNNNIPTYMHLFLFKKIFVTCKLQITVRWCSHEDLLYGRENMEHMYASSWELLTFMIQFS